VEHNPEKSGLILHTILAHKCLDERSRPLREGLLSYQLVGGVNDHQGNDG
jgi:hypothetical protein